MDMLQVVLLALFPLLLLFNPRLALILLVVAIVLLYQKRVKAATGGVRKRVDEQRMKPWKDPWGTGAS